MWLCVWVCVSVWVCGRGCAVASGEGVFATLCITLMAKAFHGFWSAVCCNAVPWTCGAVLPCMYILCVCVCECVCTLLVM